VETPVGVVDLARTRANARRAVEVLADAGVAWRPHVKTHKSREIARLQLEAGAQGLAVATPREAEVMASVTSDLLLAYPPVGETKLARLMSIPHEVDLTVALDSPEALEGVARASRQAGRTTGVLVEMDVGMERVGLGSVDAVADLAGRVVGTDGVSYEGIMFYPGHIRSHRSEQAEALDRLSERLDGVVDGLTNRGLGPRVVSGGSTPTLAGSHRLPALTEVRAGTAIFHDREQVALGAAGWDDLAYTVLATVVSTAVPNQAVVDAGSKALAAEERGGDGYGVLLDRREVRISRVSEEHGILDLTDTDWSPRIGERIRIVPNHVCVSVNLQDRLLLLEEDGAGRLAPVDARGRVAPGEGP
jgi:D-serine deaminase-like pyridoxal phosphate-dependent protein